MLKSTLVIFFLLSAIILAPSTRSRNSLVPLVAPLADQVDSVWVNDSLPAGASAVGTWNWDTSLKASGTQSFTQPAAAGVHQLLFQNASQPLTINAGDKLVCYVYLNSANKPKELMLQWSEGTQVEPWEHRAFWGANQIPFGVFGTQSRYYMGQLPPAGQWVRLEIPASSVGLEGKTINGMAFTLYDGQAWFDYAAKSGAAVNSATLVSQTGPPAQLVAGQTANVSVTMQNSGTATWTSAANYKLGSQNPQDNANWGFSRVALPVSSVAPGASVTFNFTVTAPATPGTYDFQWRMLQEGVQWFGASSSNVSVTVVQNNATFLSQVGPLVQLSPRQTANVSVTMQNTGTSTWTTAGNYKLGSQNPQDNLTWGFTRVSLPVASVAPGASVTFNFTVTAPANPGTYNFQWRMVQDGFQWFGAPSTNKAVTLVNPSPLALSDSVWMDDSVPAGATAIGTWNWDASLKANGTQSATQPAEAGVHQLFFQSASQPLTINAGDRLLCYVYLNPANQPKELMLQWSEGTVVDPWEHRAFWGANQIPFGTTGTQSRYYMGQLPPAGQWLRLEIPASAVGLEGKTINGMAFTLYDGQAWFDHAGKTVAIDGDNAGFVTQTGPPVQIVAGQTANVSVTMQNTGALSWTSANYKLGSQNPQDNTNWGLNRVALPVSSVAPGASVTFNFPITAPATPGTYNFQWRMLQGTTKWIGAASTNLAISVVHNDSTFMSQTGPPQDMNPGQTANVSVTMKNSGTSTWTSAGNYMLGSQNPQDNTNWGASRITLPVASVAPGASVTFNFTVTAPAARAFYDFQWRMVQGTGQWFGASSSNIRVKVGNLNPIVINPVGTVTLGLQGSCASYDLSGFFASNPVFSDPDGDSMTHTASSGNAGVATVVAINTFFGWTLKICPVGLGNTNGTVTADDGQGPGHQTTHTFQISVVPNRPPTVVSPVGNVILELDDPDAIYLPQTIFKDLDNDEMSFTADSANPSVAIVAIGGISSADLKLIIQPNGVGTTTGTITATDSNGNSTTHQFNITVTPSTIVNGISPVIIDVTDERWERNLVEQPIFIDPEGDTLTYTIPQQANPAIASAFIAYGPSGDPLNTVYLRIIPAGVIGTTSATIRATDPVTGNTTDHTFTIKVKSGTAPHLVNGKELGTVNIYTGNPPFVKNLSSMFKDDDDDTLTFTGTITNSGVATLSVREFCQGCAWLVELTPVATGEAFVTITADDGHNNQTSHTFRVRVNPFTQNTPPVLQHSIHPVNLQPGDTIQFDPNFIFFEPEETAMTFTINPSDNPAVATVRLDHVAGVGLRLIVDGLSNGRAHASITARDAGGLMTTHAFSICINGGPAVTGPLDLVSVFPGQTAIYWPDEIFTSAEGTVMSFSITPSSNPSAAIVRLQPLVGGGPDALFIDGVSDGSATATITATDPGGCSTTYTISIAVGGG